MFREEISQNTNMTKTILLLADCWSGAMAAGRFAAHMLFDERSQIILLNTYQRPVPGMTMTQSVTPILEKTAKKDLEILKNVLETEYDIPSANITEKSEVGELVSVIQTHYSNHENLSVVLGQNQNNPLRKGFCRNMISTLLSMQLRPVFLVSNIITLVENSRIFLVAEKEENISSLYRNYLSNIFPGENKELALVTQNNTNSFGMERSTARQFSDQLEHRKQRMNPPEHLLYELMRRSGPD